VRLNGHLLDESVVTLAEILSDAGIETAAFVGAYVCSSVFGLSKGFQSYDDPFTEEHRPGSVIAERSCFDVNAAARKWISTRARKPFFLWIHYFDPHAPHEAPLPYASWFPEEPYHAEIAFVDEAVGQLLRALGRVVEEEELLVVVVGDHGEGLDDHDEKEHGHLLFDTTMRVPLIVAGGPAQAGKRVSSQVRLIDLAPTIQEWFLGQVPLPGSGKSLMSMIRPGRLGKSRARTEDHRSTYGETIWPYDKYGWSPGRRFSQGDWTLILDPQPRLFRVDLDPGQQTDLALQNADQVHEMVLAMDRYRENMTQVFSVSVADSRKGLENLGYVGLDRNTAAHPIPWGRDLPSPTDMIGVVRFERRGWAHKQAGRMAEAEREFMAGLALDPGNLEFLNEVGLLRKQAGDFEGALKFFEQLDEAERETCLGLINQGNCHEGLEQWVKARSCYERASGKDPGNWKAWFNLARLHLKMGDLEKAEGAWKNARDSAPTNTREVKDLGTWLMERLDR